MLANLIQPKVTPFLERLLQDCDDIHAALVVTVDGNMCAMQQKRDYTLERLATMGSSLMSLGDTITAELEMGACNNIISENEQGIVAFMHINDKLVLISITTRKNALGMLLSHSRICAKNMALEIGDL
jgi:predicted regulator of Ras-like GTPase activity (Roadblock/LC7/MglB family)